MAVTAFRGFANGIRQPSPYFLGLTELKGATNLIIGFLQFSISGYMKCSQNPYYNSLARRHWDIGTEAMTVGIMQFAPGFLAGYGALHVARANNITLKDIIDPLNISFT